MKQNNETPMFFSIWQRKDFIPFHWNMPVALKIHFTSCYLQFFSLHLSIKNFKAEKLFCRVLFFI